MKNEGKLWTYEESEFLKRNYSIYGPQYCSEKLFRNKKAIIKRANILKIKFNGIKFIYLQENLEPIIKESLSITEVIKKLGLKAAGGNHKTIKNYIERYCINISHFNNQAIENLKTHIIKITIPLEDILVENSNYNRTHLKARLYKEGLKKHECEDCGQGEEWNGKKMSLILDHKNGINNDNRLLNLRILCPNCASTLPTHCRGSKGLENNKKIILEKTKKILIDKRNRAALEKRIVNRPPFEELKKEIKITGYSATGRKYGVSDNAIRKWIKSYEKYGL